MFETDYNRYVDMIILEWNKGQYNMKNTFASLKIVKYEH
jgi:hypothetical protein